MHGPNTDQMTHRMYAIWRLDQDPLKAPLSRDMNTPMYHHLYFSPKHALRVYKVDGVIKVK